MRVALTPEQESFVQGVLAGHNVLVDACVGSGKTTAIQELCRRASGRRILYLTYNKLLKLDAQARIAMPGVRVQNYHGFAWGELHRSGIGTGVSDIMENYNAAKIPPYPIDLLVLDEYQDINGEIAAMLEWLRECCPMMAIAAVGDMRQKLYDWTRMDVAEFIAGYLGPARLDMEFTVCFRLSAEHAARVGRAWSRDIKGWNPDLEVREIYPAEAYDIAAACAPEDLLVMGKKTGAGMTELLNELERRLPDKFNKHTVWAKILDHDGGATQPGPSCAIFTTYDGSKGMERDTALVYDFTEAYWEQRLYPETANPDIVRNIFLVAASRGKKRILFVRPQRGAMLGFDAIRQADKAQKTRKALFDISTMFDFKFAEDVSESYRSLDVDVLEPPGDEIRVSLADGLIDLSPCIGIWSEASYFSGYDLDEAIVRAQRLHPGSPLRYQDLTGWTAERLILYITALETGQVRYISQVGNGWVPAEAGERIHRRLAEHLPEDCMVQVPCSGSLDGLGYGEIRMDGICDAYRDNMIWELKFTAALTEIHCLQLASYLLVTGMSRGRLFNIRTGELREIRIRNRPEFESRLARTVTKGLAAGARRQEPRQAVKAFAQAHPRAFREMEALAKGAGRAGVEAYLAERNLEPPLEMDSLMPYFRGTGSGRRRTPAAARKKP